jgi:predicted nucleic acid-binding protein
VIYVDSSVLFSLHSRDAHTLVAAALLQAALEPFAISSLCEVEVVNAFHQRVFRREITKTQAQESAEYLELNVRRGVYRSLPFPESAYERAKSLSVSLTPSIGVRAADLLHVAAALELGTEGFFTFDQKQWKAAKAEGLKVNPLPQAGQEE